jgi:two-component system chemotaxis response regulator CheY
MSGMSGLELLRLTKQKYASPPLIVMMITGYGDDENYSVAMKYGTDDFLTRPVDFTALKEKLKSFANMLCACGTYHIKSRFDQFSLTSNHH